MHQDLSLQEIQKEWHGTLKTYLIGFLLSILLTLASFYLVFARSFSDQSILYTIVGLALVQAAVQLFFFLHMGQEAKPRWETLCFCFMFLVLLTIAIGSLWIMNDLNARMMPDMNM